MAKFAFNDCALRVGGYIRQSDVDSVSFNVSTTELDVTCFGSSGWRQRIGGLSSAEITAGAFEDYANGGSSIYAIGDEQFQNLGSTVTFECIPDPSSGSGAAGDVVYFTNALRRSADFGASVGDPMKSDLNIASKTDVVRGQVETASQQIVTSASSSTGVQLGAVSATQRLWYCVSVESAGSGVTCIVESDDNSGFTTATTQATLATLTAQGGTFGSVAGAVADDYWRFTFTPAGGADMVISAVFGIQ